MRVVLDTNVVVRAVASPGGPAGELFERIAADHVLVTSPELLSEIARVLGYDRVRRMHRLDDAEIGAFVASIESGATVVRPEVASPQVVVNDADDDRLISTAIAGHASVICTLDRHLFHSDVTAHCQSHSIEIMSDIALLQIVRGDSPA